MRDCYTSAPIDLNNNYRPVSRILLHENTLPSFILPAHYCADLAAYPSRHYR
jgi:hypothetical protein